MSTETKEKTTTELDIFKGINLPAPAVVSEKLHTVFEHVLATAREEMKDHKPDLTTKKGREAIASLAYKMSRTKSGLDDAAKKLTVDQQAIISAVNKERNAMKETLDGYRDDVRKPLNVWEAAETVRKQTIDDAMTSLGSVAATMRDSDSDRVAEIIRHTKALEFDPDVYRDRHAGVIQARQNAVDALIDVYEKRLQHEQDQAELDILRREKEERDEQDRIDREEAEQAERDAAVEKARLIEIERIEKEARDKAEADAAEKVADAERRAEEADEEAEKAARNERDRIAEEQAEERRQKDLAENEARERADDVAYREAVEDGIIAAISAAASVSQTKAELIVDAIIEDAIPGLSISYEGT